MVILLLSFNGALVLLKIRFDIFLAFMLSRLETSFLYSVFKFSLKYFFLFLDSLSSKYLIFLLFIPNKIKVKTPRNGNRSVIKIQLKDLDGFTQKYKIL
jgi:hypothetical protein